MIRIALAQFDFPVGDIAGNAARILRLAEQARDERSGQLVLFPELALSGYLAEDLLLRPGFLADCEAALASLAADIRGIDVLVGHPLREDGVLYNAASWIRDGRIIATYRKQELPNYTVFDEKRYFEPAHRSLVVELAGTKFGVVICEDIWEDGPTARAVAAGAEALLVINASPYDSNNRERRLALVAGRAREHRLPMAYVNTVGGQDDLVFDGASVLANRDGTLVGPAPTLEDHLLIVDFDAEAGVFHADGWASSEVALTELRYRALVRATRDYVEKNRFPGVLLGLSGGVDSALTLAIAVDALGPGRVHAVMMPSRYTSQLSLDQAAAQARNLGVRYDVISIEEPFAALANVLAPSFAGRAADITEENMQARARGVILMALSNKFGHMVLATGNKSEMAVGYATIYGDMCGGFAPLKDCYKTVVYDLCRHRNTLPSPGPAPAIPEAVIDRPPSAELRADQKDQDSLPPYDVLDDILERYVERSESREEIVAAGHDAATVDRVVRLVLRNEYKRRQGAPGTRITPRAFGRDRRYPITNGWVG